MSPLRKFLRIGWADRFAILRAGALLLIARAAFALLRFSTVLRLASRYADRRVSPADTAALRRMVWAVEVMGQRLFPRNPCLTQAVVVQTLFRRAGREAELCIGVRRQGRPTLEAHAWVECDGEVVIGRPDPDDGYTPLPPIRVGGLHA